MKPLHIFLLFLVVSIWGFNFVFVKIALQEIPPLLLCFSRFFLVSIPAIFFFKRPSVPFKWVVLYGLVMFVLQFALMFSGIRAGVSPGLSSLLLQTQVFFSIPFAALFLKERINRWQVMGALLAFSGISVVGFNLNASASLAGLVLVLSSAVTWGAGSVIVKKMGKTNSGSLLVWGGFIAWPPLLLLSLYIENSLPVLEQCLHLSWASYGAVCFITFGSTVVGFGIWNWLVQVYPISTIAPFTLLVPIFGMLSSLVFLGEPLESWKIMAAVLVISGLCLNVLGPLVVARRVKNI